MAVVLTAFRDRRESVNDKEENNQRFLEQARAEFDRKYANAREAKFDVTLDNYERVCTLGTGTFGQVLLIKLKEKEKDNSVAKYLALKVMEKQHIVKLKQIEHVMNEKKILFSVSHPFIIKFDACFKDNCYLYLTLEYVGGGEMFRHLRTVGRYKEDAVKFYGAQVILALEYLHHCDVLYRDLKPENLLFDTRGYLRLTDFGFAKQVRERTYTLCGTPEYLAPEIILSKAYGRAVDWWACGILIYEMAAGRAPFRAKEPLELYEKIVSGRFEFPGDFSSDLRDLIKNMLQVDITKRFGNLRNGVKDVKQHKWFSKMDWHALLTGKIAAPHTPKIKRADDTSNFEDYEDFKLKVSDKDRYTIEFRDF